MRKMYIGFTESSRYEACLPSADLQPQVQESRGRGDTRVLDARPVPREPNTP